MKKPEYTEKYKGYTINIYQDDNTDSPDDWGNEDVFLVYEHRNLTVERKGFYPLNIFEYLTLKKELNKLKNTPSDFAEEVYQNQIEEFEDELKGYFDYESEYYIFPIDMYSHSGIHLSLANTIDYPDRKWDVSTTGYVLVNKHELSTDIYNNSPYYKDLSERDRAIKLAEYCIEEWNDYLSGNVWGYEIYSKKECYKIPKEYVDEGVSLKDIIQHADIIIDDIEVDSCWGFYGEYINALNEAKSFIDGIKE